METVEPSPTPTNTSSTVILAIAVSTSIACAILLSILLVILIHRRKKAKKPTNIHPFTYEGVGNDTARREKGGTLREHTHGRPPRQAPPEQRLTTAERPRGNEDNVATGRDRSPHLPPNRRTQVIADAAGPSETPAPLRHAHRTKAQFSGVRAQRRPNQEPVRNLQHSPIEPAFSPLARSYAEASEPPPSYCTPQPS